MHPTRCLVVLSLASLPHALGACTGDEDEVGRDSVAQTADGGMDAGPSDDAAVGTDADASSPDVDNGFVDPRDGQSYPTIKLGDRTWLAKNLNFAVAGSSFCYGDDPANCDEYGRLYLWSVASTVCPSGWHLGSDAEWKELEAAVGMPDDQLDLEGYEVVRGTTEGTTLKAADGFGARMAGFRAGSSYEALGDRTYFWTATTRGGDVWRRRITAADPTVFRFTNPPSSFAISVRCVAD